MWENPAADGDRHRPSWAAGVILAAGASRRMGGYPKATVRIGPEVSLVRVSRLAREAELDPVIVVLGPRAEASRPHLREASVTVVENPLWTDGRTGSLQTGLDRLDPEQSVVVWPIDHPFVRAETVLELGHVAARDALALWVIPTFEGRGGHPVILRPPVLELVRQMGRSEPLRNLMAHYGPQVRRVAVDDPGVVATVDSWPEYDRNLAAWQAREPREEQRWTGG
ncbi:MAG: NTP transferase domain-containing protein [Thermoplasmata archaeon]|nr:NTP transferase domain-containing protein [Thermoplasmata archaeon]